VSAAGQDREVERIRTEYERRRREVPNEDWRVRLFVRQQRERVILNELRRARLMPLDGRRVLDVGCGSGQWLIDFETWGARRRDLAGIELDCERFALARERLAPSGAGPAGGEADVREGNAAELPWRDGSFDVVLQATMLSSILDDDLQRRVAREMTRVLAPEGALLSYDMAVRNRRNPNVRPLGQRQLSELFDGHAIRSRRITLALPLARRLVPLSYGVASALEHTRLLDTHRLAIVRRP
jgi:ubiquinone/menaquinone biosynthesis C-methylase UbiE